MDLWRPRYQEHPRDLAADIPLRRSFPPSNTLLALGALLFGAAAGTGIVFAREAYGFGGDTDRDLEREPRHRR